MIEYGKNENARANLACTVTGDKWRFSVLTDRMIRMEYSETGEFVDRQTQIILNRRFPVPEFTVEDKGDTLQIATKYLLLTYDKKPFSSAGLQIQMMGNPWLFKTSTWFYGDEELLRRDNLGGSASTLDNAVGDTYYVDKGDESKPWGEPGEKVPICPGLLSKAGFSVIDDSKSLVFNDDGWVEPAPKGHTDVYFLCYGRDYLETLNVFFTLSGPTPLLPRYALGNWWSRYYSYTQDEYMALQERFRDEGVPIAVGVLDMGWHHVDIDPKYGKGWTGYSWNRELFPDPEAMMTELHDRGMHVSLNVHPADGVRSFEDAYVPMAKELGVDYEHEIPIQFDVTDRAFMDAYFKYLHHPNEKMGVDFWWMDWQQGSNSKMEGYDPLWMLNHYHFVDNAKGGNRPMDFSRYAGLGSHRYPIGFSGSTFITWESLDFQPWFTATASNMGLGWWSHDIGGHRNGYRDDELTTRWVQFGVFSPIMRLHSSNEVFTGKEPWKFCADSERVMRRFLKLRHKLVPYTYTMNHLCHSRNLPLVQPVYYHYPAEMDAYKQKNEYFFGSELLVSPITSKCDAGLRMGSVMTWLPEGAWIDVLTGVRYRGGRRMTLWRDIDSIPVLAKAGGIIPLQAEEELSSRTDNPKHMELCVFAGADGVFRLYEDDGISMDFEQGKFVVTEYRLDWENRKFIIGAAGGDLSLIPEKRGYTIRFYSVSKDAVAGASYDERRNIATLEIGPMAVTGEIVIDLKNVDTPANDVSGACYEIINRAQCPFSQKEALFRLINSGKPLESILSTMETMKISGEMRSAISEMLLA